MSEMRRKEILIELEKAEKPLSASFFAEMLSVTRQVIVGDIALLRAGGASIIATPRGYLLEKKPNDCYIVACKHDDKGILEELYTIVDCGCGLLDVIVEHPLYGQITCNLHIFSRLDADNFMKKMCVTQSKPLSEITKEIHLHTLQCPSLEHFQRVEAALREKNFYVSREEK